MAGYYGFDVNSSFTCQAICSSHICKCLGDLGIYLGRNSFSQRISKIYGNRKFGRSDVLKLEFEVSWGALSGAFNCLVVFQNVFLFSVISL